MGPKSIFNATIISGIEHIKLLETPQVSKCKCMDNPDSCYTAAALYSGFQSSCICNV